MWCCNNFAIVMLACGTFRSLLVIFLKLTYYMVLEMIPHTFVEGIGCNYFNRIWLYKTLVFGLTIWVKLKY